MTFKAGVEIGYSNWKLPADEKHEQDIDFGFDSAERADFESGNCEDYEIDAADGNEFSPRFIENRHYNGGGADELDWW